MRDDEKIIWSYRMEAMDLNRIISNQVDNDTSSIVEVVLIVHLDHVAIPAAC